MSNKCYSLNDEDYCYTDLCDVFDALYDGDNLKPGIRYYSADSIRPKPSDLFSIDKLFDDLINEAWDECGEHAESFLDQIDQGQRNELNELICNWLNTNMTCNFWRVANIQEHTITEEDVETYAKGFEE